MALMTVIQRHPGYGANPTGKVGSVWADLAESWRSAVNRRE